MGSPYLFCRLVRNQQLTVHAPCLNSYYADTRGRARKMVSGTPVFVLIPNTTIQLRRTRNDNRATGRRRGKDGGGGVAP